MVKIDASVATKKMVDRVIKEIDLGLDLIALDLSYSDYKARSITYALEFRNNMLEIVRDLLDEIDKLEGE